MAKKIRQMKNFNFITADYVIVSVLLFNAFTWLYITITIINGSLGNLSLTAPISITVLGVHSSTVIVTSFIGVLLSRRMRGFSFLYLWIILGISVSFLPILPLEHSIFRLLTVSFSFGFSFGFGMPLCLAYFSDSTALENRGVRGGLIFLITNLCTPLLLALSSDPLVLSYISIIWRSLALGTFLLIKPTIVEYGAKAHVSFLSILSNKSFLLYIVPWLMFCLVDNIERIYFEAFSSPEIFELNKAIEPLAGVVFAFIGGFLADRIGRKRVIIYGFVSLGVAYAVIGLTPTFQFSWYFYSIIDGIAWGIFYVMFVLVLWGDLSPKGTNGEYYAIGSLPFFFSELVETLSRPYVQGIPKESAQAAFSLASFFLFVAILPLMYAPETLPERKIELRQLRKYLEKAKRVREKYQETSDKT